MTTRVIYPRTKIREFGGRQSLNLSARCRGRDPDALVVSQLLETFKVRGQRGISCEDLMDVYGASESKRQ
jgi:hypothetical protein